MKPIKIKSMGVSLGSILFAGLGVTGWIATKDNNVKTLASILFFSSAATGLVSKCKSWSDEIDVNEKIQKLLEQKEKPISELTKKLQELTSHNLKLTEDSKKLQESLQQHQEIIQLANIDLEAIKVSLRLVNEHLKAKSQEIELVKSEKDTRFQELLGEFVIKLLTDFEDWMLNSYDHQNNAATALLNRVEYQNIHDHLRKYQGELEQKFAFHRELLLDIVNSDIKSVTTLLQATEIGDLIISRFLQVCEEISALKVRYRNLLNLDERRELMKYQEAEGKGIVPLEKAKFALTNFEQWHNQEVDKLESIFNQNNQVTDHDFQELLEKINHVARDLEAANERVAELSQPNAWKFNLNHATKVGNIIIEYCKANRVHLDRSHYTGDVYAVDLYFFTDRINAAQTVDVKALNDEGEKLAQISHCLEPIKFTYEYESRLLVAHAKLQHRPSEKPHRDPVAKAKEFIREPAAILPFIREAYHVGLWASTGGGKTTAIANIIGGMVLELGGAPTIRLTVPKIDADTQAIFPEIHWLGIPESIFGLLEGALEIQYRIHKNEQAFRAKELIQDYDPILFFIDEINLIFTRWRSINENDLENVLDRFELTLVGERLVYFQHFMRLELTNYKNQFASRLLLFIWQTGRSLRVKSLIAGQNLQPTKLGLNVSDLDNCAYMSFGDSIKGCSKYKVRDIDADTVTNQYNILQKAIETDDNLKYTALYCPSVGKSYFGALPPQNYYKWDANLLTQESPPVAPPATVSRESEMAETFVEQDGRRAAPQNLIQNDSHSPLEASNSKTLRLFNDRALLAEKYQNLDYRGYAELLASLPKKADGTVNKKQSYETIFKVWKADLRKVYSAFIDWLEASFK